MERLVKSGKTILLIVICTIVFCYLAIIAFNGFAGIFLSHQYFVGAYPVEKNDFGNDAILINLSETDFVQNPILSDLVQNPSGNHNIKLDRMEYRDQTKIENFRYKYCSNRTVTRYVGWNGTYFQIIMGQE